MCPSEDCQTPLDPSRESTFTTLDALLGDLLGTSREEGLFPGEFFHMGGDEVDTRCWSEVSHVAEWMAKQNLTESGAYGYFVNRMDALIRQHGRETIAWEEVFVSHRDSIDPNMLIQIWLGDGERLKEVVDAGFRAIVSNYKHWYLPQLWETWDYYYGNDLYGALPALTSSLKDIPEEKWDKVFGGEVCMWGETGRPSGSGSCSRCQRLRKYHHAACDCSC